MPLATPPALTGTPMTSPADGQNGAALAGAPAPESLLPAGIVYGQQNRNARVVLRIHQTARVLIQGPGAFVFFNHTLNPGDTYLVPNKVGVTLTTTNASAVEVNLDGQTMGYSGRGTGVADAISLDPQAIVDRSMSGGVGQ